MNSISNPVSGRIRYSYVIALVIVFFWYQLVSPYLSFNIIKNGANTYYSTLPAGIEYSRSTAQFYVWDRLWECGTCALWSPNMGGFPVFNDYFSSFMHPVSFLLSSMFGGFRGVTLTLATSFLIIGFASWWLMRLLSQSTIVQLWVPIVAMYGGHMTGRLETGTIGLPLSLASSMLVFAATVSFVQNPNVRRSVVLGICMATMMLAGQVYMQLGTILSLPILVWFIHNEDSLMIFLKKNIRLIITIIIISVCLTAPFVVTFILEYGTTYKKNTDSSFIASQPLGFLLLNLVIDQQNFYRSDVLSKLPYPYAYATYIGYPVIIFAILGYMFEKDVQRRKYMNAFLLISAFNFVIAAAIPQKLIIGMIPEQQTIVDILGSMRFIVLLNGIGVISLIVVSAYGLGTMYNFAKNFRITQNILNPELIPKFAQVVLIMTLVWHVNTLLTFARNWVSVDDIPENVFSTVADLKELPPGYVMLFNGLYEAPVLQQSSKIYDLNPGWFWVGELTLPPQQYFVLNNSETPDPENTELVSEYDGWRLLKSIDLQSAYASVTYADGTIVPCTATSRGGHVNVWCTTTQPGVLRVYEFNRGHWHVTVNSNDEIVLPNNWLNVNVPAGKSTIVFQYFPWYAIVYICLLIIGIVGCIVMVVRPNLVEQYLVLPTKSDNVS